MILKHIRGPVSIVLGKIMMLLSEKLNTELTRLSLMLYNIARNNALSSAVLAGICSIRDSGGESSGRYKVIRGVEKRYRRNNHD